MPRYDATSYNPPAPTAEVFLRNIATGAIVPNVVLQIDTGADTTLIPRAAVLQLGLGPIVGANIDLVRFDGTRTSAPLVELDMIFLRRAYRGRYVLIDDDRGILGRDVLRSVRLLLDGPNQEWSEQNAGKQ